MLEVSESFTTFTQLGIRCWDPVVDRQVNDALTVTASPLMKPQKKVNALQTPGGVYAFHHLPGMREIEYGYSNTNVSASPATSHGFVVEISDSRNRYVSIAVYIELPLPYAGVFLSNGIGSPGGDIPKGLHLYSSVTRNMSSNIAVIRGELLQQDSRHPAAHALLMLQNESGESWYGVADAQGFYSIVFPYPDLQEGFAGSPADGSSGSLYEQSWELSLSVFYSPSSQQSLPGTNIPNYLSILHQQAAEIWPQQLSEGGSPLTQFPVSLVYNQPAVTKTEGLSQLLISPLP